MHMYGNMRSRRTWNLDDIKNFIFFIIMVSCLEKSELFGWFITTMALTDLQVHGFLNVDE